MNKKTYVLMPGDDFKVTVHVKAKKTTVLRIEAIEIENPESSNALDEIEL